MTLQQLKYVVTVAETGTITEAANRLYISQPSLTNAIRELEKEMKITIFLRTNKGIILSKEGEDFLGYARQVLEQAGITVDKFGGEAFRAAVSEGNTKLARLLLEKGADINYHKPDMVFPYASTPVTEAARSNNFPMVRWLIEQGADITIADKYGDRPYTVAVQNKNQELADYLKALEPEEWHNEQEKIRQLMPYKLPAKLVEYLKTGPLRLEFPDQEWVKWAELYSFMDVQEMTWKRKKLLSLMVQMDNYSDYLLLWSPRDKKLWYLDIEHEEFHPLAKWDDFIADPGRYLNGMIEGEFEE